MLIFIVTYQVFFSVKPEDKDSDVILLKYANTQEEIEFEWLKVTPVEIRSYKIKV